MNKRELTEVFAREIGITIRDAEVCVNTLFSSMADTLSKGGRVEIRGFGSFKVKEYKPYSGRNPKMRIPTDCATPFRLIPPPCSDPIRHLIPKHSVTP